MKKYIFTLFALLTLTCQQTLMAQADGGRLVLYLADSSLVTYPASQLVGVSHAAKAGEGLTVRTQDTADHYALTDIQRMEWERGGMEIVDLGLSVNWASCNVGASVPEEVGTFGGEVPSATWRVPTDYEAAELFYKCDWKELTLNGQPCYKVTGPNGRSIILPRSGYKLAGLHFEKDIAVAMQTAYHIYVMGPSGAYTKYESTAPLRAVTSKDVETSAESGIRLVTLGSHKEDNTANSVLLCAQMELDACEDSTATYGFLLSTDSLPTEQNAATVWATYTDTERQNYYARVYDLTQDSAYYFRAYAMLDGQKVYGEVKRVYDFSYAQSYVEWVGLRDVASSSVTLKAEALPIYKTENKDIRAGFHVSYVDNDSTTTQDYDLWTTLEAPGHYTAQVPTEQAGVYTFSALRELADSVRSDGGCSRLRRGSLVVEGEEARSIVDISSTETTAWGSVEYTTNSVPNYSYLYISPTISTRQTEYGFWLSEEPLYGTYDISVRILPISIVTDTLYIPALSQNTGDSICIAPDTLSRPSRFRANLYTCGEGKDLPKKRIYQFRVDSTYSCNFESSGTQVSTIHLGSYTFCGERAALQLQSYVTTSQRANYTRELLLDCVMMEEQVEDTVMQEDAEPVPSSVSLHPSERYSLPLQTVDASGSHRRMARRADEETTGAGWETSDSEVASVDASGIVTAIGEGTALMKNLSSGDSCLVSVSLPVDNSLYYADAPVITSLSGSLFGTWYLGSKHCPEVYVETEEEYGRNDTITLRIESSNEDVVKVTSAQCTADLRRSYIYLPAMEAVGIGTAYITVSTENGIKSINKVEVEEFVAPTSIQLGTHELELSLGDEAQEIALTIEPENTSVDRIWVYYDSSVDFGVCSIDFNDAYDSQGNLVGVKSLSVKPTRLGSETLYVGYTDEQRNSVEMDSCLITITTVPVFTTQSLTRNDSSATLEVKVTRVPADCTASALAGTTPELTAENARTLSASGTSYIGDYTVKFSVPASGLDSTKTYYMLPQVTFGDSTYQGEVVTLEAVGDPQGVDLGLSVRWSDRNMGAGIRTDAGDYYAWGEVSVKESYTLSNYVHVPAQTFLTNHTFSSTDDLDLLSLGTDGDISASEYDAVTVAMDSAWRMPTLDEMQELVEKCSWESSTLNGTEGFVVTGPSGNSMFLPCAGAAVDGGTFACYWTAQSVSGDGYRAYILNVVKGDDGQSATPYIVKDMRWMGLPIRPVMR